MLAINCLNLFSKGFEVYENIYTYNLSSEMAPSTSS